MLKVTGPREALEFLVSVSFFLLIFPFHLGASRIPPFRVASDFAQFRLGDSTNYLEIYYACDESRLTYIKKNGQFQGAILMYVSLRSAVKDSMVFGQVFQIPHTLPDTADLDRWAIIRGVIKLGVPLGEHTLSLESIDSNNRSRKQQVSYELPAKEFDAETVRLSDVEFCSSIRRIPWDTANVFYKNTLEVIPNPSRVFTRQTPILYYLEAYNLPQTGREETYDTKLVVYDSAGRSVAVREGSKRHTQESSVEIGSLDIGSLPEGSYRFEFSLVHSTGNMEASASKQFHVRRLEQVPAGRPSGLVAVYGGMNEEDLDAEFAKAGYLANRSEKSHYETLTSLHEKQRFLVEFWERQASDLLTPVGEFRQQYLVRAKYANDRFGSGFKEGWETDRGRVLILYGPPDEYDRHPTERKPYEIWYYHDLQGGVVFVFADLLGFRDYVLIHSTHRNELRDDNWRLRIIGN